MERYPPDTTNPPDICIPSPRASGSPFVPGVSTDEWGCCFVNIQPGVHGDTKDPLLPDLADWRSVRPPYETLPGELAVARDTVNRFCAATNRFVRDNCRVRPWERYQFIRGTENAMVDFMLGEADALRLLKAIHDYDMKYLEFWVTTDVDMVTFMDDWGSQQQLLIPPALWREVFKPLYRDYCDLAHSHGKYVFMHSDGYIAEIFEDLIEIGVDAVNSQLFCMDMADLARRAKGRMTFWGEIDRQRVLPAKDPAIGRQAVREVVRHLFDPAGGLVAEFEIGPGANPAVAEAILDEWAAVDREWRPTAS